MDRPSWAMYDLLANLESRCEDLRAVEEPGAGLGILVVGDIAAGAELENVAVTEGVMFHLSLNSRHWMQNS